LSHAVATAKLWTLLFTAMVPTDHNAFFEAKCVDRACVDRMIHDAETLSKKVSRIRVFEPGTYTGHLDAGATPFPAFIDIQIQ
jgi:hypothetical protein